MPKKKLVLALLFVIRELHYACFLPPPLWSTGDSRACALINCKLLLGYHSKRSWVETNSKTLCRSKQKWSPAGSVTRLSRGLIIACHSWAVFTKQQKTHRCTKWSWKCPSSEGCVCWAIRWPELAESPRGTLFGKRGSEGKAAGWEWQLLWWQLRWPCSSSPWRCYLCCLGRREKMRQTKLISICFLKSSYCYPEFLVPRNSQNICQIVWQGP